MRFFLASALIVACMLAGPVAASEAPAVTAALKGDTLIMTFPTRTMPATVSFVAHGVGVTQSAIQRRRAFQWSSETELSVDLKRFHRKHHGDWKVTEIWVWGQLASGEALLQKVVVNP